MTSTQTGWPSTGGARSAFIDAPCAGGTTQDFTIQTLNQFGPRGTKDPQQGSSPTAKHCLHPPALTLSLPSFAAEQQTCTVGFPLYTEKELDLCTSSAGIPEHGAARSCAGAPTRRPTALTRA